MVIEVKYEIEKSKANQACDILNELEIDAWLVWVRETSQMADPVLDLVLGGDLVWQSALMGNCESITRNNNNRMSTLQYH